MNIFKKIDSKMEIYRDKDYDLADLVIAGGIGTIIGVLCMYPLIY